MFKVFCLQISLLFFLFAAVHAQLNNQQTPLILSSDIDGGSSGHNQSKFPIKIAIVGAGPGGSTAAYYLQKYTNHSGLFNVTVFEKADRIGGRTTTVNAYNDSAYPIELGASIFVPANKILVNAADSFHLPKSPGNKTKDKGQAVKVEKMEEEEDADKTIAIWNGEKVIFQFDIEGTSAWRTGLRFLYRYGAAPIKVYYITKQFVNDFVKFYYKDFFPFANLTTVSKKSGFLSVTNVTGQEYLQSRKVSEKYSNEIIQSLTRVNYAQNLFELHGVETLVSLAAEDTYHIEGGNWKIFEAFVNSSKANVKLQHAVTEVQPNGDKRWKLSYNDLSLPGNTTFDQHDVFDHIIIAAPYHQTGINGSTGRQNLSTLIPEVEYVTLHVTLFATSRNLSADYFQVSPDNKIPTSILTTLKTQSVNPKSPFFSISVVEYLQAKREFVYKIFSPQEISAEFIENQLLSDYNANENKDKDKAKKEKVGKNVSWLYKKVWKSYPKLKPLDNFLSFELADGLWYLNTIETFISTMETAALAGANTAALISDGRNLTELVVP